MEKVLLTAALVGLAVYVIAHDHYDAIRHEFYQVWDSIEELRGGE